MPANALHGISLPARVIARDESTSARRSSCGGPTCAVNERRRWVQGDAMSMTSFPDEGFDAATMGYGLRNVADIPRTLRELLRVLRPGEQQWGKGGREGGRQGGREAGREQGGNRPWEL